MTPLKQATSIVKKYLDILGGDNLQLAIDCAKIAVDEIIATDMLIDEDEYVETPSYLPYWQDVKQELKKL